MQRKDKFLGHQIGEGKIYLQDHIAKKILQFPDVMSDKKNIAAVFKNSKLC